MELKTSKFAVIVVFAILALSFLPLDARAVPSFQRQTGLSCNVCHTIWPQLTPFGRSFKLGGYTMSKPGERTLPIAAMVEASFTSQKGLSNRVDPYDNQPDAQWNVPQAASVFYAGQIYDHFGALAQLTYNGVGNNLFLDNTDVRYANTVNIGDTPLVFGAMVNNNPSVQDAWNTTPAWRFPFAVSAVAVTPAVSTVIDGLLAQKEGGVGVYGFWNNLIYAEASIYRSGQKGLSRPLTAGTDITTVTTNTVPYWRLVAQHQWGSHSFELGTYGLRADIFPAGGSTGPTDRFTDTAGDFQYQYINGAHVLTAQTTFIHEKQELTASFPLGLAQNRTDYLNTFRADLNYHYRAGFGTIGGAGAFFSTHGTLDPVLYTSSAEITGNATGSPDSRGFILEADYLPWDKVKFSLQYIWYNKFNGGTSNYDGFGTKASDNNTLFLLGWLMF